MKKYIKPATSIQQQIDLLKSRGLIIPENAHHLLSTVSFHRLSAYFYPYEKIGSQQFQSDISLEHIWELYTFDRQLRLFVLDSIERIEIALRTALIIHLSVQYSPWWYLEDAIFKTDWSTSTVQNGRKPKDLLINEINQICKNKKHNDEIKHFYEKYDKPTYPPSWIVLEFLSFGQCTSIFRYL